MKPDGSDNQPRWTVWGATWLSILTASLLSAIILAALSKQSTGEALEQALANHLSNQARLISLSLAAAPIDMGLNLGGRTLKKLQMDLAHIERVSSLNRVAILGPEKHLFSSPSLTTWVPALAEADLIDQARTGATVTGPLYRTGGGSLYLTTYSPILDKEGALTPWVLAIEGNASSLGAVDRLGQLQMKATILVIGLTGIIAALLAKLVVTPLRRLSSQLSKVHPGDSPQKVTLSGAREIHAVAATARDLLSAILRRDHIIKKAHQGELDQLTRMAAEVAHEIRNPLNAIALSIERLPKVETKDTRLKLMHRFRSQIADIEHIVQRLVHLANPLSPVYREVDTTALLLAIREETQELGVKTKVECPDGLMIRTDPVMVSEVLRNLCLNAVQSPCKTLDISVEQRESGIHILVKDDGMGIPDEHLEHLFTWFHTSKAQGSGLGLPTSRRMMQALGGTLTLESKKPACFRVTLPLEAS